MVAKTCSIEAAVQHLETALAKLRANREANLLVLPSPKEPSTLTNELCFIATSLSRMSDKVLKYTDEEGTATSFRAGCEFAMQLLLYSLEGELYRVQTTRSR